MKIKRGFMVCKVGDSHVVMSIGSKMHMRGLTTLNETGVFIWNQLKNDTTEEAITQAMCAEFDIDEETARADVHEYVAMLRKAGFLA